MGAFRAVARTLLITVATSTYTSIIDFFCFFRDFVNYISIRLFEHRPGKYVLSDMATSTYTHAGDMTAE